LTKTNNIKNFSLLLVLSAVITITLTTPNDSFATITGGQVTGGSSFPAGGFNLVTPPIPGPNGSCAANSVGDDCQQTDDLWGFDEDQNITLTVFTGTLTVDDSTGDGLIDGKILPIGTEVASHYVYYDPDPLSTIVGCVQFDSPIVATIFSTNRLFASDFLVNNNVNYLNPAARGFELADDIATFTFQGSEVCVDFKAATPGDYFRVLTEFSPGALEADLSITKSDDVNPIVAGNTLTYTVRVANAGPDTAENVVVTDTLPTGVTFGSTSGCTEDTSGVPTCSLGNIAAGDSAQYTVEVTVDAGTSGTITNRVSVTSDTTDPDTDNNATTEDTTVNPPQADQADLSISKVDDIDPILAGKQATL